MGAVVKAVVSVAAPIAAMAVGGPVAAAAVSMASTAVQGGDLGDIVKSGAASVLGGAVGKAVGSSVAASFGDTAGKIAGGAAGGFTGGLVATGDISKALTSGVVGGATSGIMSAGKSIVDSAFPGETTTTPVTGTDAGVSSSIPTSPFGTTEAVSPTSPFGTTGTVNLPTTTPGGLGSSVPTSPYGTTEEVSKTSPYGTTGTVNQPTFNYPSSTYTPPFSETTVGKAAQGILRSQLSSSLADIFSPSGSTAPSAGSVTSTGQSGTTPGTQALGQALRVDPGATLGGGDQTKPQENVWNLQSLRVKDETGS